MYKNILHGSNLVVLWLSPQDPCQAGLPDILKRNLIIKRLSPQHLLAFMQAYKKSDVIFIAVDGNRFETCYQALQQVAGMFPQTCRIVLEGDLSSRQSSKITDLCYRSLPVQTDIAELLKEVDQYYHSQKILQGGQIQQFLQQLPVLPSLPEIYQQLSQVLAKNLHSPLKVAAIISQDRLAGEEMLRLVNSRFFSLHKHVYSLDDAVSVIGVRQLRDLYLAVKLYELYPQSSQWASFSFADLYARCLVVGRFAQLICRELKLSPAQADKALLAALLKNIGMLIFASHAPHEYQQLMHRATQLNQPLYVMEKLQFQISHTELGAAILQHWQLPAEVIDVLLFQYFPNSYSGRHPGPLTAVHIADALIQDTANMAGCRMKSRLNEAYLKRLGILDQAVHWQELAYTYSSQLHIGIQEAAY